MAFRAIANRQSAPSSERRNEMLKRIDDRIPIGILAMDGKAPVGWCSVAPRDTFNRLSPKQDDDEEHVWSITCFTVLRARRGEGLGRSLLGAAVKHAFRKGAKVVEGYPVDRTSPSYRHMGFRSMFEQAGFKETGKAGTRRHVMRLEK